MCNISKYMLKVCSTENYEYSIDKYALVGIVRKIKYRGNKTFTNPTEVILKFTQNSNNSNFTTKEISIKARATNDSEYLNICDLTPNDARIKVIVDNTDDGYKIYVKGYYENTPVDVYMIGGMPSFIEFYPFKKFNVNSFINRAVINKESSVVEANITMQNSWQNISNGSYTNDCRVYLTNTGVDVYIKCKGGSLENDTTIFTFDTFKPESDIYLTCYSWDNVKGSAIGTLYITTNGEVKLIQNENNPIYNSGLRATTSYNLFKY